MATLGYTPGSGAAIRTDLGSISGAHIQIIKLAQSGAGSESLIQADANGLLVNISGIAGNVAITAAATLNTLLVDGSNTALGTPSNPLVVLNTPPASSAFWRFHYTYGASQTGILLHTPPTGKTIQLLQIIITPTAVGHLSVYDNIDINTTEFYNGQPPIVPVSINYPFSVPLGGANRSLYLTTGAGAAGDIVVQGFDQ